MSKKKVQYPGIKGFVMPTKSFVKIEITKIFSYNYKMLSSINETFDCCSKIFGSSYKKKSVVPNFVAVAKPSFFRETGNTKRFLFKRGAL